MPSPLKIKPVKPLELGWIPYWNLTPIQAELLRKNGDEFKVYAGSPTAVNKWLAEGRVALAPCSSICLLKNSSHEVAVPVGVAARGAVQSVYLGVGRQHLDVLEFIRHRQKSLAVLMNQQRSIYSNNRDLSRHFFRDGMATAPIFEKIPQLVMTPASATSATLSRILYRLWFGECPQEMMASEHMEATSSSDEPILELLIGDEALIRRPSFAGVIDLGEAWTQLTGLPFVFAVWQVSKRLISPYWKERIVQAAELAQAKMTVDPTVYLSELKPNDMTGHRIDLTSYWKTIHYRLQEPHFQSLVLFLCLARQLAPDSFHQDTVAKLMRMDARIGDLAQI